MSGVLNSNTEAVYVRPARSIGGIALDVTVSERHDDDLEITGHPVEQGAEITDHAYPNPAKVTVEAGHSDAGGSSDGSSGGDRRCVEVYEALRELQRSREPFDLVTGKRVYSNMLIKSLSVVTDAQSETVLSVKAELQEVLIATAQAVSIPRSRQRHASRTGGVDQKGQKQAEPVNKSAMRIALEGVFGW